MKATCFLSQDIECEGCAQAIRKALRDVAGVLDVVVDVDEKLVNITHDVDLVSVEALRVRLDHAGFAVTERADATTSASAR